MSEAIKDLIERLESASEGSEELDDAILAATRVGWTPRYGYLGTVFMEPAKDGGVNVFTRLDSGEVHHVERVSPAPYTRSLDVALSLVPELARFELRRLFDMSQRTLDHSVFVHVGSPGNATTFEGEAATLPLALVIACLRARTEIARTTEDADG